LPYSVTLTADAADDFRRLDGSLKKPVAKQLKKLETFPLLGEHLGNTAGLDLTGYFKLNVAKKGVRIVYPKNGSPRVRLPQFLRSARPEGLLL
jgi:mRNA interferase RelE/StbE